MLVPLVSGKNWQGVIAIRFPSSSLLYLNPLTKLVLKLYLEVRPVVVDDVADGGLERDEAVGLHLHQAHHLLQ